MYYSNISTGIYCQYILFEPKYVQVSIVGIFHYYAPIQQILKIIHNARLNPDLFFYFF